MKVGLGSIAGGKKEQEGKLRGGKRRAEGVLLTPRHLFRQLEPSLFFNGHTTSLLTSVTEKELVSDARGGMVCMDPSWRGGLEGQASEPAQAHKQA